jgi:hypothetical protein
MPLFPAGLAFVTLPALPSPSGSARDTVLAAAVAVSAGCATLIVRAWEASWRSAAIGAVLFGLSPALISFLEGSLNPATALVPPTVLVIVNELLVRQRLPWWVLGAVLGLVGSLAPLHAAPVLAATGIALGAALLVIAVLRPEGQGLGIAHAVRAVLVALPVAGLALAYPVVVDTATPGRVSLGIADHHQALTGHLGDVPGTLLVWARDHLGAGTGVLWLLAGAVGAVMLSRLSRTRAA